MKKVGLRSIINKKIIFSKEPESISSSNLFWWRIILSFFVNCALKQDSPTKVYETNELKFVVICI
jgi:hypothetical protein